MKQYQEFNEGYRSSSGAPQMLRLITKSPFHGRSIVSYGIVAYALDTCRWLVVRRKHSAEFVMVMRGSYRPAHLYSLLLGVTADEESILRKCIASTTFFRTAYTEMFHEEGIRKSFTQEDIDYASLRIDECSRVILSILDHRKKTPGLEWLWPKGRLQPGEDTFSCALREFHEEAGFILPPAVYVSHLPLNESFCSIAGRPFESKCWLYAIPDEIALSPVEENNIEIAERRWVSFEEALQILSPSKIVVLRQAVDLLEIEGIAL